MVIFIIGLLMGVSIRLNPLCWLGGILFVIGYSMGFAGIALAVASKTDNPGSYHMLIFLLNLPLLFLSNALYPISSLPTWMKIGAKMNPTSYLVEGLRHLIFSDNSHLTNHTTIPLWVCILVMITFSIFGMTIAYISFKRTI